VQQGIDAAFLLDHARLGIKTNPCRDRTFCTFFGRSEIGGMDALVADLERRTGLKAVPVSNWFKCRWKHADRQFGEMIATMARANFILTDTYHLCVNALNLGVPVVAVGRQTNEQAGTLGDHKKKVLFKMFGLGNNYIATLRDEVHQEFHDQVVEAVTRALSAAPGRVDALNTRISRYRNLLSETVHAALVKKG
jgi:polysaccharide pyruvyl transferase WcaK-like protein